MPFTAVSTVPGAITTLQGYMNTVAAATAVTPAPQVYLGKAATPSGLAYNFLQIGDYAAGVPVAPDSYTWRQLPGTSGRRTEAYALMGCIGCWSGGYDAPTALARLNDAFTLLNALHNQIRGEVGGSGTLSGSGAWGELVVTMEAFEAINTGWGVVLGFELHVINAQLTD